MVTEPVRVKPKLTIRGEQTRLRILGAAAALIFEHGVAGTTVEAVQAAAVVSASQLYHYFGDKDDLVGAVIDYQADIIIEYQASARLDSLEGLRAWRDMVVALERSLHCRGGCPLGSLASQLAESNARARAQIATSFERWEAVIHKGLRAMYETGQLRPEADPAALALATLAALQGGLMLSQVQRDTVPLETALDAMLTLIGSFATSVPPDGQAGLSR